MAVNRRVGPPRPPAGGMNDAFHEHDDGVETLLAQPPSTSGPSGVGAWLRGIAGVVLVVGVASAVAGAARRYIVTSPRFSVVTIDINGVHHLRPEQVMELGGLNRGANIFLTDLNEARAKLLANPWIADVTLARRLPDTLVVELQEREAAAVVALGDSYLASREGEIFKRLEANDPADLPIITGITPEAVADDRDGVTSSVRRALDLASDFEHSRLASRGALQEIHLASDGTTTMIIGKTALSLALGAPPFRRKLEQASRILAEVDAKGAKAQALFLDNEARPERVVVRVR